MTISHFITLAWWSFILVQVPISGVLGNLKFHLDGYAVFQATGPSKERTRRGCRMLSRRRLSRDCAKFLSACYAVLSGRRSWIAIAEWLWQHLYP